MMRVDLQAILTNLAAELRGRRPTTQTRKGRQDYVTDLDQFADQRLTAQLSVLTPGVPVLSEERKIASLPQKHWLIDPIDGTANLIAGLPFTACAAALVENGTVSVAGVADIHHARVFTAARNEGAYCDGDRLSLPDAAPELLSLSTGVLDRIAGDQGLIRQFRHVGKFRNLGSQALQLCAVASGTLAANISVEARRWDDAAGALIVQEAGGVYRAFPAGPRADDLQRSVATHPKIANDILRWSARIWSDTLIGDPV